MKNYLAAAAGLLALVGTAQAQSGASGTYAIDPTHTFVSFEVSHFGTSTNRGRWDKKEGTVQFDRAAKTGRVEITIDMGSINTGVAPFDNHLKSKDFFNATEHPTARFVGEKFVFAGEKVTAVEGTLTLLGKSQPVVLKANNFNCYMSPMVKREVCGGDFEATIQPTQWDMAAKYIPAVMPDRVRLIVQAEAIKQ
ncbi:MAG: YceI family protein [Rubrivivax sp.]|nr:YceI family protein [Rubrivivax sp.]